MKYDFNFSEKAWNSNNKRLTNQIFKILPLKDNNEDWAYQRDTVVLELQGYNRLFKDSHQFMILIGKLLSLEEAAEKETFFRKTIFEAITCLKEIQI